MNKKQRLANIFDKTSNKTLIIPVDDDALSGPENNLLNMKPLLSSIIQGGANGVLGHRGTFTAPHPVAALEKKNIGKILNVTFSSTRSAHTRKIQSAAVEDALILGVDAVAVHINAESKYAREMFEILSKVVSSAYLLEMPVIAFMYPRGENENGEDENHYDLRNSKRVEDQRIYAKHVRHAVRIGAELGADLIKAPLTEDFDTVIEAAMGVPVIMGGGSKVSDTQILFDVRQAIDAGAVGALTGRNTFEHKHPEKMVFALSQVVHYGKSPQEAMELAKLIP